MCDNRPTHVKNHNRDMTGWMVRMRLFPYVNIAFTIYLAIYNLTTLGLNGTLSCVDLMDIIRGDIPTAPTPCKSWCVGGGQDRVWHGTDIYPNHSSLNGALSCVVFMYVLMGIYPI